jgi:hypothetical protein
LAAAFLEGVDSTVALDFRPDFFMPLRFIRSCWVF